MWVERTLIADLLCEVAGLILADPNGASRFIGGMPVAMPASTTAASTDGLIARTG